jgi:hypothetical protein
VSFLVRSRLIGPDGDVVHDETVVAALGSLEQIERDFETSLGSYTFRLNFDPPLVPEAPAVEEAA